MFTYIATAGANKVISTGPAILERIIIGKSVGASVVEISDDPADGDGDIKIVFTGDTLIGSYEIGGEFRKGICADVTNQTDITFVWSSIA